MLIGGLSFLTTILTAISLVFYFKREDEKASSYALISIITAITFFILICTMKATG